MSIEYYRGRPLGPGELEQIRQQIEHFDIIDVIEPVMREIVKRNWPDLIAKLPQKDAEE